MVNIWYKNDLSTIKEQETVEIAKNLEIDHRAVNKLIKDPFDVHLRADKGVARVICRRQIHKIKREANMNPYLTSSELFKGCGKDNVPKSTRCRMLKRVARSVKPGQVPFLEPFHKVHCLKWPKAYMKIDLIKKLFTNECLATLDGSVEWRLGNCTKTSLSFESFPTRRRANNVFARNCWKKICGRWRV